MNRLLVRFTLASILLLTCASAALADVKIRIAVSPTTIPLCTAGHFFIAVGNTGTQPILARVCISLVQQGTGRTFGPICGRVALAAGERREHEFNFFLPPLVPTGDYAFVAKASGSDGTTDQSVAPFTVVPPPSPCGPIVAPSTSDEMMNGMLQSSGITPDGATPTQQSTWGSLKIRYR